MAGPSSPVGNRLTRDLQHSMLGGVCAGVANRYHFDATLVRVVMVLLTVATGGIGLPIYLAAWIVMPRQDAPPPAPRSAAATPESLSRELREVSDRLAEAARVLAEKARQAAEEISEIAHRAPATAASPTQPPPAHASIEEIEESEAMPNGGEPEGETPPPPASAATTPPAR